MLPGRILAKSLSTPRYPGIDGAYSDKISFYAPMTRLRRGLLRQNPYLRPDIPVSTGLITAKSLSTPRCPGIDGAYYGKILIYAPMSRYRRGLLRQNPYLRPDVPVRRGLLRQNPYLRPDILPATGLITAKFLSAPRCTKVEGIIDLILSHIPAFASSAGYR